MDLALDARLIARAVKGRLLGNNLPVKGVSIDSRKVKEGELFVALIGQRFNAHEFVKDAFRAGAVGALVSQEVELPRGRFLIKVDDTLRALRELGKFQRSRFKGTVVGVAGSAGKTTTKEMIYHLLSEVGYSYRSPGNLNSQIGLPLVLSNMPTDAEFAVLELGASKRGEVANLTKLARPKVRVITAIGEEHLETFGSLEDVIEGNGEIFTDFGEKDLAVLPYRLKDRFNLPKSRVITFGEGGEFEAKGVRLTEEGVRFFCRGEEFEIPLLSLSAVENALAAFGVLKALGYNPAEFRERLRSFRGVEGRMQVIKRGGIVIIDDTYNANPPSVRNALRTLASLSSRGKKIAVLGDMLELGESSPELHREVGRLVAELNLDTVLFYGKEMRYAYEEAVKLGINCFHFNKSCDITNFVLKEKGAGNIILFKGSRGVRMELVLQEVVESLDGA